VIWKQNSLGKGIIPCSGTMPDYTRLNLAQAWYLYFCLKKYYSNITPEAKKPYFNKTEVGYVCYPFTGKTGINNMMFIMPKI
jgi:hypothetical protein